ncbi:MAG TPA: hypothetical protein PKL84_07995, partial [Candidatus Hydrogenedentes bacterium]|nr:hypothetical protein [Candidatus Hydrogenedentota bacterium]
MSACHFLLLLCGLLPLANPDTQTLPPAQRPAWVAGEGIVMAGSWEPLLFRVRRDGADGYLPTPEQRAAYDREHSPPMIEQLKALGVNFVMMHCHKGGGLEAEHESMQDAARFAKRCRDAGLHVGVYNFSGAFLWELLFDERPEARDWVLRDAEGNPRTYGEATYRYYWNRNHPDARAYYHCLVRFAVEDIGADLLHFDNYTEGPGMDDCSVARFRDYLSASFSRDRLAAMDASDLASVRPPMAGPSDTLLRRAWLDFHAQSLADSYVDLSRYARSLRKDILIECNPGGPGRRVNALLDHGRLLQGGEAFWDESRRIGMEGGRLSTRIQTYKVARAMDNMAFTYTTTPLEMAESMAFNLDCLGCICWFEYGNVVKAPGVQEPLDPATTDFVRFFRERRDLFRHATVVADVAVLRSYPSQAFAPPHFADRAAQVEQTLIETPTAFQIVHDHQLAALDRYKVLVLAECVALSDRQVAQIRDRVARDGALILVGEAATHTEWMEPRPRPAFEDLPPERVLRIPPEGDLIQAVHEALGGRPALQVIADPSPGVCA